MPATRYQFADLMLDTDNRSLCRDGSSLALNARYFDALVLLVSEHGQLVGKQRFFDQVWAGSVVTDAALTQCIKEIRRVLGDDAGNPRFVRTVAGHGYRFVAEVHEDDSSGRHADDSAPAGGESGELAERGSGPRLAVRPGDWPHWLADAIAATAGGAVAGLLGGLLYGSLLAVAPTAQGLGGLSVLLVLLALSMAVGMAGALGVGLGLALGLRFGRRFGRLGIGLLVGGTLGGLLIGGTAKLLGSDAFTLLIGQAPTGITGGLEGATIGFALGLGLLLGGGPDAAHGLRPAGWAALSTALAGALLSLGGGSLMAGSLARVAASFADSRLDLTALASLVGASQLGPWAQAALGALEGGLFAACVVGAMIFARRQSAR